MSIYFAPEQDCLTPIRTTLASAKKQIRVLMYILTEKSLIATLVSQHSAGVDVQVILDASEAKGYGAVGLAALKAGGVPVLTGSSPSGNILHDKLAIADSTTIHGSYNWTGLAAKEGNSVEIVRSGQRAAAFLAHWQTIHDWVITHPGMLPTIIGEV